MYPGYSYLNGGDCKWFGDCMIQQILKNGFIDKRTNRIDPWQNG